MTSQEMERHSPLLRQRLVELSSKRSQPSSPGPFTALSDIPETPVKCSPPPSLQDSGYFASDLDSTPRNLRLRPILRHAYPAPLEPLRPLIEPSPQSLARLVHYLVVVVVAASLVFGVLVSNHSRTNMKYEAIQFGKEQATNRGLAVTDSDSGDLLGGKRAAIQFYHDRQRQLAADQVGEDRIR